MRRGTVGVVIGALATAVLWPALAAGAAPAPAHRLHAGERLTTGHALVSADGRYRATVRPDGHLLITRRGGRAVWQSHGTGAGAHLTVSRRGQVLIRNEHRVIWRTATAGSGRHNVLTLSNDGALTLRSGRATVWSSRIGNDCRQVSGKAVRVDISQQFARMCADHQQVRTTPVTTGAVSLGDGTPTGTWHVQARIRNTTLYPAAGGAYPVKYWMPYNGAYGMHDSSWQHFRYGSAKYRTEGSHGCVHVPGKTMAWLFNWAAVGTTVTISA
jgi:hypothetical protein